jgi:hypothetical protein
MPDLRNYRIYCNDENIYIHEWSRTMPTNCPNSASHILNADLTTVVETKKDISYTIRDVKTTGTNGGDAITSTWITRDLNDIDSVPTGSTNVLLNNGTSEFTIKNSGIYSIYVKAPVGRVNRHRCRLFNITDNEYYMGTSGHVTLYSNGSSIVNHIIEIYNETTFRVDHYVQSGRIATGLGDSGAAPDTYEIYTYVKILLLS